MENTIEKLQKSLSDKVKREKKHRTFMLLLCMGIVLCGIGLMFINFWASGVVAIIMAVIIYLKIHYDSYGRLDEFQRLVTEIIHKNEPKS